MKCRYCGKENKFYATYCESCGRKLHGESERDSRSSFRGYDESNDEIDEASGKKGMIIGFGTLTAALAAAALGMFLVTSPTGDVHKQAETEAAAATTESSSGYVADIESDAAGESSGTMYESSAPGHPNTDSNAPGFRFRRYVPERVYEKPVTVYTENNYVTPVYNDNRQTTQIYSITDETEIQAYGITQNQVFVSYNDEDGNLRTGWMDIHDLFVQDSNDDDNMVPMEDTNQTADPIGEINNNQGDDQGDKTARADNEDGQAAATGATAAAEDDENTAAENINESGTAETASAAEPQGTTDEEVKPTGEDGTETDSETKPEETTENADGSATGEAANAASSETVREETEETEEAATEAQAADTEKAEAETEKEAEKKAEEEAEKKAQEEAEKKAQAEAEKKAEEEAEKKAEEEAEKKAEEEAEKKAQEEAEKKAQAEAEKKAEEEAEKKAQEEAEKKAQEEAEKKAQAEAKKKAQAKAKKKAQAEAKKKAQAEAREKAEAEEKAAEERAAQENETESSSSDSDEVQTVFSEPVSVNISGGVVTLWGDSGKSSKIGEISSGEEVVAYGQTGSMYYVEVVSSGQTGWIDGSGNQ